MKKILFVCLGNICRSPVAEASFRKKVEERGLLDKVLIDSAGISAAHSGEFVDHRMVEHAKARGLDLSELRSRKFSEEDMLHFDYIVAMDKSNMKSIRSLDTNDDLENKLSIITQYCSRHSEVEVPDPYIGEGEGFDKVLNILEDATEGFLNSIESELKE
ncbi:hypothetical protein A9Q84_08055 [Halobacteriovorax marinus]|uniref:Phosphotyrosine protein phosphatase I domain-containing protein n=1 Tax=Halobacteriovorax marinus TaxID=97084 RepID=A0A1Y5F9W6_9BACT|nr:hypothetical protein A9Q84_08055 [Halobacteriovorax marinus]